MDTLANRMAVLDREGKPHILSVVTSEYRFKAAVVAGREQEAVEVIFQNSKNFWSKIFKRRWPRLANFWDKDF